MNGQCSIVHKDVILLEREIRRRRNQIRRKRAIWIISYFMAVVLLLAGFCYQFQIMQMYGESMNPTIQSGDIIFVRKGANVERNDVVIANYENKTLVKRVIGLDGQEIDFSSNGVLYVNQEAVLEGYLLNQEAGALNADIVLPYVVPKDQLFVMGDNRLMSIDSRNSEFGTITENMVSGKVLFRLWPLNHIGPVK